MGKGQIFWGALAIIMIAVVAIFFLLTSATPSGEKLQLELGQSAIVEGSDIEVTFVEVVEDSRCPRGALCVWEGRAVIALNVAIGDKEYAITVTEPNSTEVAGYTIQLTKLEPYPTLDQPQDNPEYTAYLIVAQK